MNHSNTQAGFSVVEVLIATLLLTAVVGGIFGALGSAASTAGTSIPSALLDREVHRALHRIAESVSMAGVGTLIPAPTAPLGSDTLSFRVDRGYSAGSVVWGPEITIRWEPAPADPSDGLDNDGDGIVDEGQIVWIRDLGGLGERRHVWLSDVLRMMPGEISNGVDDNGNGIADERGLSFELEETMLTIRLSAARVDADRRIAVRSVETSVRMRN